MSTPVSLLAGAARTLADPDATDATRQLATRVLVAGRMPPATGPACPAALAPLVTAQLAFHALARAPDATVALLTAVLADAAPAALGLINGTDTPEPEHRRQAHRVRVQRLIPHEILMGVIRPGAPLAVTTVTLTMSDARSLALDLLHLSQANDDPAPEAA